MRKLLAVVFTVALMLGVASAQEVDSDKLHQLAVAISKAEGFGMKGAVPTRYHNPGDIRTFRPGVRYPGQVGINRQHYAIFRNDKAGFAALESNLRKIAVGESAYYGSEMTINKMAKLYATKWRIWAKNVAKNLDVPVNTKLIDILELRAPEIPVQVTNPTRPEILLASTPIIPVLATQEY
jgi:hypothetical protein